MNATFNSRESILYDIGVKSSLRYQQFVQSESISSPNGNLVVELAKRISLSSPDEIPKPYKRLLGNICKISSVAGFLQILTSESLEIWEEYCNQSLDLRSAEHAAKQKMIREEMPALWPNLIDILNLENASYLPGDVSSIILKMIHIRRNTFLHAAVLSSDDYIEWEDQEIEHPTQVYPNWKIWRYPKTYIVRNISDC